MAKKSPVRRAKVTRRQEAKQSEGACRLERADCPDADTGGRTKDEARARNQGHSQAKGCETTFPAAVRVWSDVACVHL